ncbi:MAG: hypothetical protein GWP91_01990 [Rhodobacterales bacterium]|nr:hypothetical protein [Rhodobacterales bacterium]
MPSGCSLRGRLVQPFSRIRFGWVNPSVGLAPWRILFSDTAEGATALNLTGAFRCESETATFDFSGVDLVQEVQAHTLMTAASGIEHLDSKRFVGNAVNGLWPMFSVVGEKTLQVTFVKT